MGSLEEVSMPQNGIFHQGIMALAGAFAHNPKLRKLDLSDNIFTEEGAKAMAKVRNATGEFLSTSNSVSWAS